LISPHDAFGTNLYAHVLRGKIMRIVPRENEAINETWIADRDRFGFEGSYSPERATMPMMRLNGTLTVVDWETALAAAAEGLAKVTAQFGANSAGFLASPSATLEELFLLSLIARRLGCDNIDHRLRQLDFRGQAHDAPVPGIGMAIADVENLQGILVVGSNLRHELPMLAHRVRKAAVRQGAKVAFLNPRRFDYLFPVAAYALAETDMVAELAAVLQAASEALGRPLPETIVVNETHRDVAKALLCGERRAIFLGTLAQRHPRYAELKDLGRRLAELTGAKLGLLTEGANAAGAHLAGVVPHRLAGGAPAPSPGLAAADMLAARLKAYVLFGGIEPAADLAGDAEALNHADLLIAVSTHLSEHLKTSAHIVLPIGCFAESAGTFVNIEGRWQSWQGAAKLVGESRPGWKVLRVLANLLQVPHTEFNSAEEVRAALAAISGNGQTAQATEVVGNLEARASGDTAWIDLPPYQGDVLVRGSEALAKTQDGRLARVVL